MIQNPILPGFNPDPSICRVGDDYCIATSTFEWFPGVQIHHSRDLQHWSVLTHALHDQIDLRGVPSSGGIWAPALSHHDGVFYHCYTVVHQHQAATNDTLNFLTTATSIEGPWTLPVFVNSSGFDPSLFHQEKDDEEDDDDQKYRLNMVWDHRPGHHPFDGIALQQYDASEQRLAGQSKTIFKGSSIGLTEGPPLYQLNGWYCLLTAEGGTDYEHAVSLARSGDLDGPHEVHLQDPILTSSGRPDLPLQKVGHASLVETQAGEWYMPHLCGRPLLATLRCNLGRETAIQKVEWRDDDWLYLVGVGNHPKVQVESPQLPSQPWGEVPARIPFDSVHYATRRLPLDRTDRQPDKLVLRGDESLESSFRQAMLARRLGFEPATVTTRIRFQPDSFQQLAGLVAHYNTYLFHYLYISPDEQDGRCLLNHSCDDGVSSFPLGLDVIPVPARDLNLRMVFDDCRLRFSWSADNSRYHGVGSDLDASILSDDHGEHWRFTGTFVGLAWPDLTGQQLPAEFDYLEVR